MGTNGLASAAPTARARPTLEDAEGNEALYERAPDAHTAPHGHEDRVSDPGSTAGPGPAAADAVRRPGGAVPGGNRALGIAAGIQRTEDLARRSAPADRRGDQVNQWRGVIWCIGVVLAVLAILAQFR